MARKTTKKRRRKTRKKNITVSPWIVLAVVLLLALVVSIPYLKKTVEDTGAVVPTAALSAGGFAIDISHYQHGIVWDSLSVMVDSKGRSTRDITRAKDVRPVKYAFIKATEGERMVDPEFEANWEAAGESRVKRGAYHFFRSSKDPVKQAESFISTVGALRADDLPPVLDVETIHKGCTRAMLNESLAIWLETVENHYHRKPIIYASDSFLRDNLSTELTARYPIWVAHYGVESPIWDGWHCWQFTDKAVVRGAEGKVDLSAVQVGNGL